MTPKKAPKKRGVNALFVWLPVVGVIALAFSGYLFTGLIGMTLAVVSFPLYKWLRAHVHDTPRRGLSLRQSRNVAAFTTEGVALLAVVLVPLLPMFVLYHSRELLVTHALALYGRSTDWGRVQMSALGSRLASQGCSISALTDAAAGRGSAQDGFWRSLSDPMALVPFAFQTMAGLAILTVHGMVLAMSMHVCLLHGPDFWEHILEHAPDGWLVTLQRLGQRGIEVLRATYVVQGVTAAVAFVFAIPVFWFIVGRPNYFLAAVLCGVFQLVPFLGSAFLILGFFAYFLIQGEQARAWECLFVAMPLVAGVADLAVRPVLARSMGRISGITMLVGFVAGMEAFGLAGFVLGPLCLELFVCFTAIMLYGPHYQRSYQYPARTGLERRD